MLDAERRYYDEHEAEWAARSPGSFAVVKGEQLLGIFPSMEVALSAGAHRFWPQPFLVRQLGASRRPVAILSLAA